MRRFSLESLRDERQRFETMLDMSKEIERLHTELADLRSASRRHPLTISDLRDIRAALMNTGAAPLNVTQLPGILAQSQRGYAVLATTASALPDPSLYEIGTLGIDTSSFNFYYVKEGTPRSWAGPIAFPVTGHSILSSTHSDSVAATVVRGDVIAGNSTPAWARLAIGAAYARFRVNSGGTDPQWETSLGACAYRATALAIANNTVTTLTFDAEDFDRGSICNSGTGTITIPAGGDGPYLVVAGANFAADSDGYRELSITAGGAVVAWDQRDATTGNPTRMCVVGIVDLAAAETITATVVHTAGANLDVDARSTFLAAWRL